METVYDYIIVGGGIAGLYAYEKLANSGKKVLIIEASNKIGGRMGQDLFYNTTVSIGAGIGRKSKDHLLIQLLKRHRVKVNEFTVQKRWLTELQEEESRDIIEKLKHTYNDTYDRGQTFKEYATRVLGQPLYKKFIKHYEYTDMEQADVFETLFYYGLEDNHNGWTGLSIPWNQLLDKMMPTNLVLNHRVQKNTTCDQRRMAY
jgi:phytoene dehydrogenase-like protein